MLVHNMATITYFRQNKTIQLIVLVENQAVTGSHVKSKKKKKKKKKKKLDEDGQRNRMNLL